MTCKFGYISEYATGCQNIPINSEMCERCMSLFGDYSLFALIGTFLLILLAVYIIFKVRIEKNRKGDPI